MGQSPILAAWLYAPLALLALLGLWMLKRGTLWDRARNRRRCPQCWYDMSGLPAPPVQCPECGRVCASEHELTRTRRKLWLAALGLPLLLPLLIFFAHRDARHIYYALPPKWSLMEEIRVNETRARLYGLRNPETQGNRAIITSGGKTILDVEDAFIEFGQTHGARYSTTTPLARVGAGDDLNGDGIKDLVVFSYSGGAHCCYTVYVLEFSDPPRIVATIDGRNGIGLTVNQPSHGVWPPVSFDIPDQSFDYWNTSHAESPFPRVWYRLNNHHLEIALDEMIKPREVVISRFRAASKSPFGLNPLPSDPAPDPATWGLMLDLLYSGNDAECWKYFDNVWPDSVRGKVKFKAEFLDILNKSPQYQDFLAARAALAKGDPIPPALVGQYKPQPLSTPPP